MISVVRQAVEGRMRRLLIAAWLLGATGAAPTGAQEPADLLLRNGKVFAADELLSTYSAVAVRDGRIAALGSDILPLGPLVGLQAAVTRRGMGGEVVGPGEALSMPEAIVGYTRLAAHLTFEEDEKGTLEVGKLADIAVLSQDLLTIDPERTTDTEVDLTVLGGRVVFER